MTKTEGRRLATQHASPTSRETFLDDITPTVDSRSNRDGGYKDGERHSHDLSIPAEQGTRDSLVENMLFSLNGSEGVFGGFGNISVGEARLYSSFADDGGMDEYRSGNYGSHGSPGQVRGVHGHSLSSSDYNEEGRSSSQYTKTRERRSVSSGAFTMANGKGTSMAQQRAGGSNTLPRSNGKGGSKGSGGSFDLGYAQVTSNQRWAQGYAGGRRRSSSMEGYGQDTVLANLARQQAAQKDLELYDAYEAAPTPTVPREPRRIDTAQGRPESPMYLHSPVDELGRRVSNRNGNQRGRGEGYGKRAETSDGPGQRGGTLPDQNRRLPPLPAFKQEPQHQKKSIPPPQKQEKPGFFRRVFGSTRNLNAALKDATDMTSPTSNASMTSREPMPAINRPEARPEPSARNTSYRSTTSHGHPVATPSPQPQMTAKEAYHSTQQTLKKTPSSFFRRRKKSVEMAPPPMPLPPKALDFDSLGRLNSPTGSLMGAMKPYMNSPTRPSALHPGYGEPGKYVSDSADTEEDKEDVRGFSPQWLPDKNATIRSVDSPRRDISQAFPPKSVLDQNAAAVTDEDLDRTFLHESSDNELQSPTADKDRVVSQTLTVKPDTSREGANSPALSNMSRQESKTARDMQMVQEYNDKFAKRTAPVRKNTGQSLSLYPTNSNSIGSPQSARSSQREVDEIVEKLEAGEDLGDLEPNEVVIVTPRKEEKKPERVRLEPTLAEETMAKSRLGKIDTTMSSRDRTGTIDSSQSTPNVWYSATELPLNGGVDSLAQTPLSPQPPTPTINLNDENKKPAAPKSRERDAGEPTTEDKDRARKIYDGNEDFILKSKAAAWIGEVSPARSRTLHAYMSFYDFKDMSILTALRALCNRLVLRAESQQVDRILVEFSKRWCRCNPNHGFKSWDVVHTICYSLLLLNTDLHVADIEKKMTKDQFVKNALPTILQVVEDAEAKETESKEAKRPSIKIDTFKSPEDDAAEAAKKEGERSEPRARGNSLEIGGEKTSWRNSLRPGATRTHSDGPGSFTALQYNTGGDDCGPLVKAPFHGNLRTWEFQVEIVLKDFYNAIKAESLPLFDAENQNRPAPLQNKSQQGHSTLSVFGTGMLRRTPSVISKAGSESGFARGRTAEPRLNTGKWSTKNGRNRSRVGGGGSVYNSSLMGGSRTSLDDNSSSIWSPSGLSSGTSGWGGSKYSLGKTHTSMSVNSLGSGGDGDYHQSIGFANALSNAIIKEEYPQSRDGVSDSRSVMSGRTGIDSVKGQKLLDDESLELEGAPWGKEGILKHKWHLDAEGKRSKERSWNEVFAVINQGYMSLFSFNSSSKSQRQKTKTKGRVTVGGGNWQDNAESLGQFVLRQTIASALPAPGYSKQRPYVFALSLPTGAVHLFQVGTETIIKEWVMTANYWSARLSNHPLVGGISNIEYGWSDAVINTSAMTAVNEAPNDGVSRPPVSGSNNDSRSPPRTSISGTRPSIQSSLRSSLDHASGGSFRPKLPADKITISDWTPPTQSMRASTLSEDEQFAYLTDYVSGVEEELGKHQMVRGGMGLAVSVSVSAYRFILTNYVLQFSKSSPNAVKVTNNWEKKSSYLLREIVKFRTYIDTLEAAKKRREEVYEERREREVLREEHGN